MNFSPVLQHRLSGGVENPSIAWSPNGTYIAFSQQSRIIIRDCSNTDLSARFNYVTSFSSIDQLAWSPDSSLVGAACFASGSVQIFSVRYEKEDWTATVREGSAGLEHFWFTPDNRNIVTLAKFQIKLTIWSLCSSNVRCVKHPKSLQTVKFSKDGNFFTAVEQIEGYSWIGIYHRSCDWSLSTKIRSDCQDLTDLEICPLSQNVAVWNDLREPLVQVFNIFSGKLLFFRRGNLIGSRLNKAKWTPCGKILILADGDEIELVSALSWDVIFNISANMSQIVRSGPRYGKCVLFEEREVEALHTDDKIVQDWIDRKKFEYVEVKNREISLRSELNNAADILSFKTDGLYLAFTTRQQPQLVWVWDLQNVSLVSLLTHKLPVTFMAWDPAGMKKKNLSKLIIVTRNSSTIYFWTPLGGVCSLVPDMSDGKILSAAWNPNGNLFALQTYALLTVCKLK